MNYTDEEFTALMDKYGDTVLRICYVRLKNMFDAQDAFQEVFISLYNAVKKPDENYVKPWLIRSACNKCVSLLRKRRAVPLEDESIPDKTDEKDNTISEAVMSLPTPQRTAVYMRYFENMSCNEIASAMGITEGNVRVLLHRGRERLKTILKEEYYEFAEY